MRASPMSKTPTNRIDRVNRAVLLLLGLALLSAGGYGLARGFYAFGDAEADGPLLLPNFRDFVARNSGWFWPAVAVGALVVAYLAFRWLRAQFPAFQSVGHLDLTRGSTRGATTLRASGATNAVAADLERHLSVVSAKARLISDHPVPELDLRVEVVENSDLMDVRRYIEHVLERFRRMTQAQEVEARLRVGLRQERVRFLE